MAEYLDSNKIRCFEPDNTETKIYLRHHDGIALSDLRDIAKEAFGNAPPYRIMISSEHIQTRCLGYDQYDPADYDDFLVFELVEPY